jgi:uncharacterized Zn finger protein (UPF0148 family)
MSGTCDRCGDPVTNTLVTGEGYCDVCIEWRMDLAMEAKGLDTSSPGDVRRAELAALKAEAEETNRRIEDENLRRKQRPRIAPGARTESRAGTGARGTRDAER